MNISLFENIGGELHSTCTMELGKAKLGPFQESALYEYSTLFQNFNNDQRCREAFKKATAIGIFSMSSNVSVCMDSLKLLPSTVQSEGMEPMLCHALLCQAGPVHYCALVPNVMSCCTV